MYILDKNALEWFYLTHLFEQVPQLADPKDLLASEPFFLEPALPQSCRLPKRVASRNSIAQSPLEVLVGDYLTFSPDHYQTTSETREKR